MEENTPNQDDVPIKQNTSPTRAYRVQENEDHSTFFEGSSGEASSEEESKLSIAFPIQVGRFHLEKEIARGGMGAILLGRDENFDRPLAFKVILDKYRHNPQALRRFYNEAQLTGHLQHPGIPPVHEQGWLPDGRPYFSMKLIQGRTLDDILAEREKPTDDLPQLIGMFELVCQTVAYAHSQHIIHRDLKPSNIMVGEFGEVQVMDWGLGKQLLESEHTKLIRLEEKNSSAIERHGETQAGRVLGTPAYIPPEQARGEVNKLDERCDVFSLGSILCEILTGHPPYTGPDTKKIHKLAALGDVSEAFARLDGCKADAELIDLTKRCLSMTAKNRPNTAKEVAEEIAAYQLGMNARLERAKIDTATASMRVAEERKRRWLLVMLGSAIILLLIGLAGTLLWMQYSQAEAERRLALQREQQQSEVTVVVEQVRNSIEKARWGQARFLLRRTRDKIRGADADLHARLDRAKTAVDLAEKLFELRFERSLSVRSLRESPNIDVHYQNVFRRAGFDVFGARDVNSLAQDIRFSSMRRHWIAALDEWAMNVDDGPRLHRILEVARLVDSDAFRNRFRDATLLQDGPELRKQLQAVRGEQLPPEMWAVLCLRLQSYDRNEPPLELFRKAQEAYPSDYALNYLTGNALLDRSASEAVGYYRAALALRPDSFNVLLNLGGLFAHMGHTEDSLRNLLKAHALQPDNPAVNQALGERMCELEKYDEALAHLEVALKNDPNSVSTNAELGRVWYAKGHYLEACQRFARSFKHGLTTLDNPETKDRSIAARSAVLTSLGRGKDAQNLSAEVRTEWRRQALDWFRADLELWKERAKSKPDDADLKSTLADWIRTDELKSVRDDSELAKLPPDECEAWTRFWMDVRGLNETISKR